MSPGKSLSIGYLATLLVGLTLSGTVSATPIVGTSTLLAAPDSVINFDEFAIPIGTTITNQYQSLGATFSPGLTKSSVAPGSIPNESGGFLYNFGGSTTVDPFSIVFEHVLDSVLFTLRTNPNGATLTAKLNGVVQESFVAPTDSSSTNPNNMYGFTGINFDEVVVDVSGSSGDMNLDTLQMKYSSSVPEPATLMLLGLGLLGLPMGRRWKG